MNETQALEGLWNSIGHAPWPVVIGFALAAICLLVKFFTEGKARGQAKAWLGAIVGTAFGVACSLAAGGEWRSTVVLGLFGGASSTGLLSLIKGTIPEFGKPSEPPGPMYPSAEGQPVGAPPLDVVIKAGPQTPYDPPQEPPT